MKVLCIGNSTYDIIIPVDKYPIENKKIKLTYPIIEWGGGSCSNDFAKEYTGLFFLNLELDKIKDEVLEYDG